MKRIEDLCSDDLNAMLGRDAEGSMTEFKRDIPVHHQNRKQQADAGNDLPRDTWWTGNKLADYGRDCLLEEVVAFANAGGGRLFLGIEEEKETTVATEIRPVPRIADLETRFRDCMLSCIEPRLPQFTVRGLQTDGQGGGVLVVEVQPSRLGPHRVVATKVIPVRRADKCVPATMSEVHAMVLRNARRFDDLRTEIDSRLGKLQETFHGFLMKKADFQADKDSRSSLIAEWLRREGKCAYAIRAVVCAHDDLGISRLAAFDPIIPDKRTVVEILANGNESNVEVSLLWPTPGNAARFLGGVRQTVEWDPGFLEFNASREGVIEQTFLFVERLGHVTPSPAQVAGFVGCALGIYDLLRAFADRPDMPAEIGIQMLTLGKVGVGIGSGTQLAVFVGSNLPANATFPHRTAANEDDVAEIMHLTAQDFLDSANHLSSRAPFYKYYKTSPKHQSRPPKY